MSNQASFFTPYLELTDVKDKLQVYCATVYSRSGVNYMWILKIPENFKTKSPGATSFT